MSYEERQRAERTEVRAMYRRLAEFTRKYKSDVGVMAQNKLIEWRALMGFQLGDEWFEDEESEEEGSNTFRERPGLGPLMQNPIDVESERPW